MDLIEQWIDKLTGDNIVSIATALLSAIIAITSIVSANRTARRTLRNQREMQHIEIVRTEKMKAYSTLLTAASAGLLDRTKSDSFLEASSVAEMLAPPELREQMVNFRKAFGKAIEAPESPNVDAAVKQMRALAKSMSDDLDAVWCAKSLSQEKAHEDG